jgi:hypothetical protein
MNADLMPQVLIGSVVLIAGVICVVGAIRRWEWLVDPPTWLWFCYSQSLVKAVAGTEACRSFTLVIGVVFIAVGVYLPARALL